MKLETCLKITPVVTTLILIMGLVLSSIAVNYEDAAYQYYDQWYYATEGSLSESMAWTNYLNHFTFSSNLLTIAGILIWVVLAGLLFICLLVFLIFREKKHEFRIK